MIDLQWRDTASAVWLDENLQNQRFEHADPQSRSQQLIYEYLQASSK